MSTALQIIEDAFDDIGVKPAETDLADSEINIGIRRLNRMAVTFASGGLNFGFTKIVSKTDTITIPDWAEELFVTHLAIRLASGFEVMVSPSLVAAATDAMSIIRRRVVHIPEAAFPNTLPIGSGNYQGDNRKFFFDDTESDLQTSADQDLLDDTSVKFNI